MGLLAVAVMKETSYPPFQLGRLLQIADGIVAVEIIERTGVVEKLTLELRGESAPPHHDCRSQAPQNMLIFVDADGTLVLIGFRWRHDIVFER